MSTIQIETFNGTIIAYVPITPTDTVYDVILKARHQNVPSTSKFDLRYKPQLSNQIMNLFDNTGHLLPHTHLISQYIQHDNVLNAQLYKLLPEILEAVKQNGRALQFASVELKNDKEVVLEAVKNDGHAFEYASDELKNDKDVVLKAVKNYGYALSSASVELKNDKEVVLEAVKQYGYACVNMLQMN
jgi:hypothetical protein